MPKASEVKRAATSGAPVPFQSGPWRIGGTDTVYRVNQPQYPNHTSNPQKRTYPVARLQVAGGGASARRLARGGRGVGRGRQSVGRRRRMRRRKRRARAAADDCKGTPRGAETQHRGEKRRVKRGSVFWPPFFNPIWEPPPPTAPTPEGGVARPKKSTTVIYGAITMLGEWKMHLSAPPPPRAETCAPQARDNQESRTTSRPPRGACYGSVVIYTF